jgi:cholesterol transport system auxiliary component
VSQSTGVVAVRASVFRGHALVDQRSFRRAIPAASADAAGGARALAAGTDAVAADIVAWLAGMPATVDTARR